MTSYDSLPDFRLPIPDLAAAAFWWEEWMRRWSDTKDMAFKEAADDMRRYIEANEPDEDDE